MPSNTVILLSTTAGNLNVVGQPFAVGVSLSARSGLYTVQWGLNQFLGRVILQATLSNDPNTLDWFDLTWPTGATFKQYNIATTGQDTVLFTGNFTFVRAQIDRSYDPSLTLNNSGTLYNLRLTSGARSWIDPSLLGGFTGSGGFAGSSGAAGFVGSFGYTGSIGPTGFTGSASTVGGFTGSIGPTGFAGSVGYTGSRGSLNEWFRITGPILANEGDRIIADTTGGSYTVTLPAAPVLGNYVQITDGANWQTNNLIVSANGGTFEGGPSDTLLLTVAHTTVELIYDGATWQVTSMIGPAGYVGSIGPTGFTGSASTASGPAGFTGSASTALGPTGFSGSVGVDWIYRLGGFGWLCW